MAEDEDLTTAGDDAATTTADRDPGDEADTSAGDTGSGASDRDPEPAAGGKRRDPAQKTKPDDTEASDDDSDDMSDVLELALNPERDDADGDKPKTKATPKDEEAEGEDEPDEGEEEREAEDDESGDDASAKKDEAKEGDKPDEDRDPDDLSKDELDKQPKKVRRQIERLVKLKPAARFGESIAAVAEKGGFQDSKTLMGWLETGGRINSAPPDQAARELIDLAVNIQTKGAARGMRPDERAKILRDLADRISPQAPREPEVLTLDDDLDDAVRASAITKKDAEVLMRSRVAEKRTAAQKEQQAAQPPQQQPQRQQPPQQEPGWYNQQDLEQGIKAAQQEYRSLEAKYGSDWKRISKEVIARVTERSQGVHPSGFAQLVKDQAELVLAKHRKPAKTPPKSPAPASRKTAKSTEDDVLDDDELLDRVIGKKAW